MPASTTIRSSSTRRRCTCSRCSSSRTRQQARHAAATSAHAALVGLHEGPHGNPPRRAARTNGRSCPCSISTDIDDFQEFSVPNLAHGIEAADIDRSIQLLIRNLVEIKDTSGEFLLRLDDGRVIDTKGWNDWEWTHGIGLYGILQVLPADARRALPRDHAQLVPRPLRRGPADQEHQHRRAVPHPRLSARGEPEQRLAAVSRRMGRVAHGRPAAHRGKGLPAHRVQLREPRSSSGTTR